MYGFQRDFVRKFHISHFWVNECVLSPVKEMPMWNGVEEATSMKLNAMRISRVYNDDGNVKIIFSIFSISFSRDLFTFLEAYICTHFERKSVRRSLHRFDAKKNSLRNNSNGGLLNEFMTYSKWFHSVWMELPFEFVLCVRKMSVTWTWIWISMHTIVSYEFRIIALGVLPWFIRLFLLLCVCVYISAVCISFDYYMQITIYINGSLI